MGNRAVITTEDNFNNNGIGIYLHWNGGYDSVDAFLKYAKFRGVRSPLSDPSYFWSRLSQIIGNYFGGNLSVGINCVNNLDCDNFDNGVYIIDDNFNIVDRKYYEGEEQTEYPLADMLASIDKAQPEGSKLKDTLKEWNGDYFVLAESPDDYRGQEW